MRYTGFFKCWCGAEWDLEGNSLEEVVDRASDEGCPKLCEGRIIYMLGHHDEKKVPLKQFMDHGLAAFERFPNEDW